MAWSSRSLILLLSLPVATVCAALLYYLSRKDEDWEDIGVVSGKSKIVEMKIPATRVPCLIGRSGSKIKEIQESTNTRINFKEGAPDDEFRICRIRGTLEDVTSAQEYINDFFIKQPELLTEELWVPQHLCGRIIGRCGETIKSIASQSNAHIVVEKHGAGREDPQGKKRQVLIRGTAQEISVAKRFILAKLEENDRSGSGVARAPRTPYKNKETAPHWSEVAKQDDSENLEQWLPESEKLQASASSEMTQVYVSSVATPHTFWVQLINSRSTELDHLVEDMTEYYSKEENRVTNKLKEVCKGQIIAAPFAIDNRWYRVEVSDIYVPGEDPLLDVFYVDYGDSSFLRMSQMYQLSTDFLSLRFQAIECRLAYVSPNGYDWTEEVNAVFEDMLHTAEWKHVMLKVVRLQENSIPLVTILDPETGCDVGTELVKRGLAVKDQLGGTEESKPPSDESKPPNKEPSPPSDESKPPNKEPSPPGKEPSPPSKEPSPPSKEPKPHSDEPTQPLTELTRHNTNKSNVADTTPGKSEELPKMYTSTPLARNENASKPGPEQARPEPSGPHSLPAVTIEEEELFSLLAKSKRKPSRKKTAPTSLREPGRAGQARDPWSPRAEASGNQTPKPSNQSQNLLDSERL